MSAEIITALVTLTAMEIVLGIDNIIFIAILVSRLPADQQELGRKLGIGLALGSRLALLLGISWIMSLNEPLFSVLAHEISGRDIILLAGGTFLIGKATFEIHHKVEGMAETQKKVAAHNLGMVLAQIALIDIVFSLDSVITAVGMANQVWIMATAMIISVIVMLLASGAISRFVERHPTIKILALSFLILIGVMLVLEGMHQHVSKGYIYFAMFFSLVIELLNMRFRTKKVQSMVSSSE